MEDYDESSRAELLQRIEQLERRVIELEDVASRGEQAQEALRQSEERYRAFLHNFQGIAYRGRPRLKPAFLHGTVEAITGYTEEELVSWNPRWDKIVHPDDREAFYASAARVRSTPNYATDREYRILRRDGQVRWLQEFVQNVHDAEREITWIQGVIYDVTARREAEAALRRSERHYRALAENFPNGVVILFDHEMRYTLATGAGLREVGLAGEELVGKTPAELFDPPISARLEAHYRAALAGQTRAFEMAYGERIYQVHTLPITDDAGHPVAGMCMTQDITERKRMEGALQKSEALYHTTIDAIDDFIHVVDRDLHIILCNQAIGHFLVENGYDDQSVCKDFFEAFPFLPNRLREEYERVLRTGRPLTTEGATQFGQRWMWTERRKIPILDDGGEVQRIVTIIRDITERKRTEEAIRQQAAQLQALRQVGLEITSHLDLERLIHSIVSKAAELVGGQGGGLYLYRPEQEVLEWMVHVGTPESTVADATLKRGEGLSGHVWETNAPLAVENYAEWSGQASSWANYPPSAVVGVPIHWGDEFLGVLNVRAEIGHTFSPLDIETLELFATTAAIAIKNAQSYEAQRRSREEWARTFDAVPDMIILLDEHRQVKRVNQALAHRLGISPYHTQHLSYQELLGANDVLVSKYLYDKMLLERQPQFREQHVAALGGDFLVSLTPMYHNGDIVGAVHILRDISHRKRAEREREQLLADLEHRSNQLQTAAEVARGASSITDLDELLQQTVHLIRKRFGLYYVGLFLIDASDEAEDDAPRWIVLKAGTGSLGRRRVRQGYKLPLDATSTVGWSILYHQARIARHAQQSSARLANPLLPKTRSELTLPLRSRGEVIGALTIQAVEEEAFEVEDLEVFQTLADQLANAIVNARLHHKAQTEIGERRRVEQRLRQRNRELAAINRAGWTLSSTLELDEILRSVLDEICHLLDVAAASIWIVDPESEELVCRQASGPQSAAVRGWRLAFGQGLAGWVAEHRESIIVSDAQEDPRYDDSVDRHTGLALRSLMTIPVSAKGGLIGVLQAVDPEPDRFDEQQLLLVEALATTAGITIENARLYEQAKQDAETKSLLLQEINHRVKNNLSAIIGLLYTAQHRFEEKALGAYQSTMQELINQVQSLATVHNLLSESGWEPLQLDNLTARILHSAIQPLAREKQIAIDISPSPAQVTPDQAHSMALVLNELIHNTCKHALPERDSAHVQVSIHQTNGEIEFVFQDDGPGYPSDQLSVEQEHLGLSLIRNIVRKNMHGELEKYNAGGAVTVIRFEAMRP